MWRTGCPPGPCVPCPHSWGHLLGAALDNGRFLPYIDSMSTVDSPRERLEFLQGTLEVLILRSLELGPNRAYGITQVLEQQSGDEFLVDNGSLYPALQRLVQRTGSAAQWKMSPTGRRAKYSRLPPAGRKQLVAATSRWQRFVEAMGRILARSEEHTSALQPPTYLGCRLLPA